MDISQLASLLLNAGGLVVLIAALLSGLVLTKAAVDSIKEGFERVLREKDERISDLKDRNTGLNDKLSQVTSALNESITANKRLADIEEERLKNWGK